VALLPIISSSILLLASVCWAESTEPAPPDPSVLAAEHERIAGEMELLARRQSWQGLEEGFRALALLGVELRHDDLVRGAYAARALGDVQSTYDRLEAALALRDDRELADWLRSIDSEYGQVVLSTVPVKAAVLEVAAMPFAPDKRAAVQYATVVLADQGRFEGRLPSGSYMLAGTDFEVEPGISLQIEVSTRKQRGRRER
jgi:hypothetical protein